MEQEPHPLNYRSDPRDELIRPPVNTLRPRLWLSHMRTAAVLCLAAIFVDEQLRYDWEQAHRVRQIEVALAVYGASCAIVSVVRGAPTARDKVAVAASLLVFDITAYVGALMPRVIHN